MVKIKETNNVLENTGKKSRVSGPFYIADGNAQCYSDFGKWFGSFL